MTSVNQAVYISGSTYGFGGDKALTLPITGAPSDTNWRRWSMLYDGSDYRMYFFKGSTNNTIYQFAWDGSSYKYGHNSAPELTLTKVPADADANTFSMVHGQGNYRLYLRQVGNPNLLYQFGWLPGTTNYELGYGSITELTVSGFPADTDWHRWSMLNDDDHYRIYAFKLGSNTEFYQGAWDGRVYKYGHNSTKVFSLEGTPANTNLTSMSMLYDNADYRLYMQTL